MQAVTVLVKQGQNSSWAMLFIEYATELQRQSMSRWKKEIFDECFTQF